MTRRDLVARLAAAGAAVVEPSLAGQVPVPPAAYVVTDAALEQVLLAYAGLDPDSAFVIVPVAAEEEEERR
jgi:hypothetical protein